MADPINQDPIRIIGGSKALMMACNQRLRDVMPSVPLSLHDDPRFLLQRTLVYGIHAATSLHVLHDVATPAHALPIVRAFFESGARMLWAVRFGWDRFWAGHAATQLENSAAVKKLIGPTAGMSDAARLSAEAAKAAVASAMSGSLETVLADIDREDMKDPLFAALLDPAWSSEEWSRRTMLLAFRARLHPASHGSPETLCNEMTREDWTYEAVLLSFAAIWLVRAVHIHCGWRQEPVHWAYQRFTRGVPDPAEPVPAPDDSYGEVDRPFAGETHITLG